MRRQRFHRGWIAGVAMCTALWQGAAAAQTIAITNARIHTMAGPVIEGGTIVLRDGRIEAVGPNVSVPAGARVIDAAGGVVTPGFLDSATSLGIVEIGAVAGTNDAATSRDRVTASFNVLDAINPEASTIAVTRVAGITRAIVVPANGSSLIAGRSALIDLGGTRVTEMVHRSPAALHVALDEPGAALAGGSRAAAMTVLREALQDARDYAANREAFEQSRRRDYALSRPDLEALVPVVRGELAMAATVHRAADILSVLALAREFGLRLIVVGATEGWKVAQDLAAANVPVVLNPMVNIPTFQGLGATLENAAMLHAAGVTLAFASFDAHNARNLLQLAGNAVAHGLPHDAALRAVTLHPARIWGVGEAWGTLEPGRQADVVVWSGDPFELQTAAMHVFIRGREVPPDTRQSRLLERYRVLR